MSKKENEKMKKLQCEVCGSLDLKKQGEFYVCESCGCRYSLEEAQNMISELKTTIDKATVGVNRLADAIRKKSGDICYFDFHCEKERARYRILEALRDTDYVADDIFDSLEFGEIEQTYELVVSFDGPITYYWTASSGYDRIEEYTEWVEKTEYYNGKSYRTKVPETRTRTVTDWRPSSGTVSETFARHFVYELTEVPGKAESFNEVICRTAEDRFSEAKSCYDLIREGAEVILTPETYQNVIGQIPSLKETAIAAANGSHGNYQIPGDRYKNLSDSADFRLEHFRIVLYPVWKGTYRYQDKSFDFMVDGFDEEGTEWTLNYPTQGNDKKTHNTVLREAREQRSRVIQKYDDIKRYCRICIIILAVCFAIFCIVKVVNDIFFMDRFYLWLIGDLIGAFVVYFLIAAIVNKKMEKATDREDERIYAVSSLIERINQFKKSGRQKSFVEYIGRAGNEAFSEMAKDFSPAERSIGGDYEKLVSELMKYKAELDGCPEYHPREQKTSTMKWDIVEEFKNIGRL